MSGASLLLKTGTKSHILKEVGAMPETKFESVVFTLMMVFCMVYCMTVYTIALGAGGLTAGVFAAAIQEMWVEYVVVFCLIFFLITRNAVKFAGRIIDLRKNSPIIYTVAVQSFTVMMIVPLITLFATFFHHGFTGSWFTQWITTAAQCFPAAYCLQVFFIGPFVRFLFRTLFRRSPEKIEAVA
jgi:hypothetical protein